MNTITPSVERRTDLFERARRLALAATIAIAAVSIPGTTVFFAAYLTFLCADVPWGRALRDRGLWLRVVLVAAVVWAAFAGARPPWGAGWHKLSWPSRYPATALDLVLLGVVLLLVPLAPRWREVRTVSVALLVTLPLHTVLGGLQLSQLFAEGRHWVADVAGLVWLELRLLPQWPGTLSGGFENRNLAGLFLAYCQVSALCLLPAARRRASRWSLLAAAIVASVLLLCTTSRISILVGFGTVALLLAGLARERVLVFGRPSRLLVAGCVLVAVLVLMPRLDMWMLRMSLGWTVSHRMMILECVGSVIRDHPLTGAGVGAVATICEEALKLPANHAHNLFLQWMADLGVPLGASISVVVLAIVARAAQRLRGFASPERWPRVAVVAVAGVTLALSMTALAVLHTPQLELTFFWSLAMCAALAAAEPPPH